MEDFIIIGSGPSGGRIAYELTKAGAKCVLLEAGKHYEATARQQATPITEKFPDNEVRYSSQLFWGGGLELSTDGRLGFLRGKCVGGTSVVNQALLDEFDEEAFSDWRQRSGIAWFTEKDFKPLYDKLSKETVISEIPQKNWNRNTKIFTGAFDKLGFEWRPLTRAQKDCRLDDGNGGSGNDCIVCLGGCPIESKQSSLVTTVRQAMQLGMKLESQFEVQTIRTDSGVEVTGLQNGAIKTLRAGKVVLAAGALGSTAVLLRSGFGAKLPALGSQFTCHPQYMTYAAFDNPVDAHKGAFQAVKSYDKKLRAMGFKLENVYAPPIGTAMLLPGIGGRHLNRMKRYRYYASMEVALRDEPHGKISVNSTGRVQIQKPLSHADNDRAAKGLKLVREFFEAMNAKEIYSCKQGFGLHLMGGCVIGVDAKTSVVAPDFKVHGTSNVFIADSSVFPSAPGINPSFTVMALSLKASKEMLK